jgi:hypothetical protein
MFNNFRFGSSGQTSFTTWNPMESHQQAKASGQAAETVLAHEEFTPHQLGMYGGGAQGTVNVTAETFAHLQVAQTVNQIVKQTFVAGAGNQKLDILASRGESWARLDMATDKYPGGNQKSRLQRVQYAQGGQCATHASLSLAMLAQHDLNAPVVQIWEKEMDHVYALIGDPRDRRYGEKNTVLVDPWVSAPSACTLAEARLYDATTGEVTPFNPEGGLRTAQYNAGKPMPRELVDIAQNIKEIDTEQVDKQWAKMNKALKKNGIRIGDPMIDHIRSNVDPATLFDCRVSTDPGTLYRDRESGQVGSFDAISTDTADRLRRGGQTLNAILNTEGGWEK